MKLKHMPTFFLIATMATALLIASGCASDSYSKHVFPRSCTSGTCRAASTTIVSIDEVMIEGTEGVLGGLGGAVLGGVIGSTIGGGSGKNVAIAAGALGGAAAGAALEGAVTKKRALEITVKYENDTVEAVVQQPGKDFFQVGQAVRVVVNADGTKRVRP